MSVRKGISILDLLPMTTGPAVGVPDGIVEQIGVLTILDHHSTTSPGFYLHEGTLQSLADALNLNTANWAMRIPGLTHGLPFRMAVQRPGLAPLGGLPAGTTLLQEDVPAQWTIDIQIRDVEILLPGIRAAQPVGGDGLASPSLQPTGTTAAQQRVYLCARGVVRISGGGPAGTQVQLVDAPDPLDPGASTGAVVRVDLKPSSFVFGNSQYGMTVDKIVMDLSRTFTPAEIEARGHDEAWRGLSLKEATLYLPLKTPLVDNLSIGVRDLVIGNPFGMQGELSVDLGADFADVMKTYLTIEYQDANNHGAVTEAAPQGQSATPELTYAIPNGPQGVPQRVRARFKISTLNGAIPGNKDTKVLGVWWELPGGIEGNGETTPWFDAPTTAVLRYRLRIGPINQPLAAQPGLPSALPDGHSELAEVTVRFPQTLGSPTGMAPQIDAIIDGVTYYNVLHLRGPRTLLRNIKLKTRDHNPTDLVRWTLGVGSAPIVKPASADFTLPLMPAGTACVDLVTSNFDGERRIRIEVTALGPLAVGHQKDDSPDAKSMVTVINPGNPAGSGNVAPTSVTDTFLADQYHLNGSRSTAPEQAAFAGSDITVPKGTDAEVEVPIPTGEFDPLIVIPANHGAARSIQVLYDWATDSPVRVVYPYDPKDPDGNPKAPDPKAGLHDAVAHPLALDLDSRGGPPGSSLDMQVSHWIHAELPALQPGQTRKFYVVGRTDDLWYGSDLAANTTCNDELAAQRMDKAVQALVAAAIPLADIEKRIESAPAPAGWPATAPARMTLQGRLALPAGKEKKGPNDIPVWRDGWAPDGLDGPAGNVHAQARDYHERPPYRCAEIFAVDSGQPAQQPGGTPDTVVLTRMLVPGPDGAPLPSVVPTSKGVPVDYRVRVKVKWDSPTVASVGDAVPTEAEALVRWKKAEMILPGNGGSIPKPTGPDFWEVLLRWAYDARTGQTEASGALSVPDGTVTLASDFLAGALALGPALSAKVDQSNIIRNQGMEFVTGLALLAVGGAIGKILNKNGGSQGNPYSTVDLDKIAISYKWNGVPHVAATLDYTVDLRINAGVQGAGSLAGHLRLAYKGVGLHFDGALGGGLANVGLRYDDLDVQVVDPGTWSLGGPLGNLIRIAASRIGNGSNWMEFDLEFALDLGVVRLEGATIRLVLEPDFSVELRGLTASVDIPATLKGKGSVAIGDGGSVRAMIALEVIPAKLGAYGALAVQNDFVSIEVGVQLPVGIPLGGTGFGIFGFMGRFVANGKRDLSTLNNPDPVQKQLGWYELAPHLKYAPRSGQFAFGVGAVIGTLPDGGFTFNAEGALTIGFPDVSVVFAIDAHLITQRKGKAEATGKPNLATTRILGMVLIEPDSVMVAVRSKYVIPKVLSLDIPFSAYFPIAGNPDAWYIRIGSDNDAKRPGDPITLTLLPEILDVSAWAFVLIEERQLHNLGGKLIPSWAHVGPLDFDGFSIGVGAGFHLEWSADPFSLAIDAFLVVGIGTKPLLFAGAAGVKGELDIVVATLDVSGSLYLNVQEGKDPYGYGHFCAYIEILGFDVGGCVEIAIGKKPDNDAIPEPPSPIAGMDLCDHLASVKGKAARAAGEPIPTVWPDTVAVLKFNHQPEDAASAQVDFVRKLVAPAALSPWSGSNELRYAYRLKTVELWKKNGNNWEQVSGPFDSAWWLPTHRKAIIEAGEQAGPSTEEGRELGLFSCDPRAWARWLTEETMDVPGNPANTVENLCDPVAPAEMSCAYGKDRTYNAGTLASFKAKAMEGAAFPSNFKVLAKLPDGLTVSELAALGADAGWNWQPGQVAPLHGGIVHHSVTITRGWRFPSWRAKGKMVATAPIRLALSKPIREGELILEICSNGSRDTKPDLGICDTMPGQDGSYGGFIGVSGARYEGGSMRAYAIGGERALMLGQGKIYGAYPGLVDSVAVDIDPAKGNATLFALDGNGNPLGKAVSNGPGRQWLRIDAKGISRIAIEEDGQPILFSVCWGASARAAIYDLIRIDELAVPRLIATDMHGKSTVLDGEVIKMPAPATTMVAAECPKLRYRLPKQSADGWAKVEIAPWSKGDISLVVFCGVTMEAVAAQEAENDFRASLIDLLGSLAGNAVDNQPTHQVHLDANATYEIRVNWQWQGWRPDKPGDDPGPVDSNEWKDASKTEHFTFSTAAFQLAAAPALPKDTSLDVDPAQGGPGYDERGFDPRGIARYLTHATPTHEDPPHFLDDDVGFWFMVDHLQPLVEKYDRDLQVKVLHTRPAAGSLADPALQFHVPGDIHVLDVTESAEWRIDTSSWFVADFELVQATEKAPCIGGTPALGSSQVKVKANLLPNSEYDLLLNTAPKVKGAHPEVAVARSHFRTSRYRNPAEMLGALGFATPIARMTPNDAITNASLAGGGLRLGDAALDQALKDLGMDPWPLPAAPRTTVIWRQSADDPQSWDVAAVLVEADEPVWRAGMTTGAYGEEPPPPRLEVDSLKIFRTQDQKKQVGPAEYIFVPVRTVLGSFTEQVRNTAGTRSIFRPNGTMTMSGGRLYDIELRFKENGNPGAAGSAPLFSRPTIVAQES